MLCLAAYGLAHIASLWQASLTDETVPHCGQAWLYPYAAQEIAVQNPTWVGVQREGHRMGCRSSRQGSYGSERGLGWRFGGSGP